MGGIQFGYNFQIKQFVIGLEGDFQYTDLSKSRQTGRTILGTNPASFSGKVKSDWLSTVRTRLGYGLGNFLGFITGGLAIADYSYNSDYTYLINSNISAANSSQTLTGWTVGAGGEYSLTDKLSIKAEYLYVAFPNIGNKSSYESQFPGYTINRSFQNAAENIVRSGVNYRF